MLVMTAATEKPKCSNRTLIYAIKRYLRQYEANHPPVAATLTPENASAHIQLKVTDPERIRVIQAHGEDFTVNLPYMGVNLKVTYYV